MQLALCLSILSTTVEFAQLATSAQLELQRLQSALLVLTQMQMATNPRHSVTHVQTATIAQLMAASMQQCLQLPAQLAGGVDPESLQVQLLQSVMLDSNAR